MKYEHSFFSYISSKITFDPWMICYIQDIQDKMGKRWDLEETIRSLRDKDDF